MHYVRLPITKYCWSHTELHLALPLWPGSRQRLGEHGRPQYERPRHEAGQGNHTSSTPAPWHFPLSSLEGDGWLKIQTTGHDSGRLCYHLLELRWGDKPPTKGCVNHSCRRTSKTTSKRRKGLCDRARRSPGRNPANPFYTLPCEATLQSYFPGFTLLFNKVFFSLTWGASHSENPGSLEP